MPELQPETRSAHLAAPQDDFCGIEEAPLSHWVPVLSGHALAKQAWAAVESIAQAVEETARHSFRRNPISLHEESLLHAYLALGHQDEAHWIQTIGRLNTAIGSAASLGANFSLYGGLCGLAWTVEHVSKLLTSMGAAEGHCRNGDADSDGDGDPNADVDAAVLEHLAREPWLGQYDLINGLVGFGVYLLERCPLPAAIQGLQTVIDHLESMAEHTETGITWHTGPHLLAEGQRKLCPDGYYNLGVAHGVPGVIHLLSEASAAGVESERCQRLLGGAVTWLSAQQCPPGSAARFGSWIALGEASQSRLAWCYGDLGILAVMLQVVRRTPRPDWQQLVDELLTCCLQWPPDKTGVRDTPLCHGATGVAHVYARIYQHTGDCRCLDAAIVWFERALAMRQPQEGMGGFPALSRTDWSNRSSREFWDARPDFIDGGIGAALALLAALTPVEPCWDRMLLLSRPGFCMQPKGAGDSTPNPMRLAGAARG